MKITPIPHVKRFIQDESGVYAVMGGLLALPIVALMFVSLESAGIIQDKARLSDSLEQAVLSLSAENNSGRKSTDYRLSGTNADNGKFNADSDIGKRDLALAKSFVMTYLPQTDPSKIELQPICKTTDKNNAQGHTASTETTCTVAGTIEHKSWFPLKVGSTEIIPTTVDIASASKAIKKNTISIPIDLMVVADLSGSMRYDLENKNETNDSTSKLGILKEVLTELATQSLFSKESNDNNRIAVAPFALGAQYSTSQCILPFVFKNTNEQYTFKDKYNNQFSKNFKNTINEYLTNKYSSGEQIERARFTQSLAYSIDIEETIKSIGKYPQNAIYFEKNQYCLGKDNTNEHHWYEKHESQKFTDFVHGLRAEGSTLVSSGLLTAVAKMSEGESRTTTLKEETKRVILVLSDGNDELRSEDKDAPFTQYSRITQNLLLGEEEIIDNKQYTNKPFYNYYTSYYGQRYSNYSGTLSTYFKDNSRTRKIRSNLEACNVIRERLNKHNGDQNTKIVFVEFGYASKAENAWRHCVGNGNYYSAKDKESLLNSFKQAIGHTDDVGHSIN
ncbi:TadE/TadG family type IV pilus assembly protein [Actinobacillus equuli]|uniref:TadE/TadG family type IV pilus assembly protein n=1 Tax=Actinobacillus equuli TaxID=718 RepID=UPI0024418385|nr:pilus assembly protein [Actinobacillus equuli]WGE80124.1 pilus assembly protein [Actinobacillus equuli subsp. equuli]